MPVLCSIIKRPVKSFQMFPDRNSPLDSKNEREREREREPTKTHIYNVANLEAMASNLVAMASNLLAMASNLLAIQPFKLTGKEFPDVFRDIQKLCGTLVLAKSKMYSF